MNDRIAGLMWRFAVPVGLLLANLVILLTDVSWLRVASGLALIFVLPGLAWLQAFNWFKTRCGVERMVLLGGGSSAIAAVALLGAIYWPGPWSLTLTLIALDMAALVGFVIGFFAPAPAESVRLTWPARKIALALLVILCVAGFLRGYRLGYAEFHEDALENMRLAVRAMAGEEYAPFLDSKGPVHWLMPGSLWLMNGWLSEGIARIPFAVFSMLVVLAVYVLGRRMADPTVGVMASGFAAVNGFFIAYARHIENPNLILLWGVLAAWCAYRFYREKLGGLLILGGLFLAVGLVTHPDVLLYLPPFGLLIVVVYWQDRGLWRQTWKPALAGSLLFLVVTLAFYMPFVLDPYFQHAQDYFASERIGTGFLYNGLPGMFDQDQRYSTRYHAPILVLLSGIVVFRELRKFGRGGVVLGALLAVAASTTLFLPQVWQWAGIPMAFLPYAVLFLLLFFSPHTPFEVKSLMVWFGIPFLGMEFLAKDAADHVQIAYPAWIVLAAMGLHGMWGRLQGRWGTVLKVTVASLLACLLGLVVYYQYLQFLARTTDYWRAEADSRDNPRSIYQTLYGGLPRPRKLFGNPRLAGWKVVGYLYETGQLRGDFRSIQESFAVPIWYTFQTPRSCFTDPQNYFVRRDARGLPDEFDLLPNYGYGLTRVVQIDGQPILYLFEKGVPSTDPPQLYDVDDYRARFDRLATPQRFVQGPSVDHPLHLTFGGKLVLMGYDASATQLAPGDTLELALHWRAIAPMEIRYRAFVHVETDRMWGQHDDDPVCRLRTDEWRPPQGAVGQFRVTLDPGTPPGTYPVTIGVYDPDSWQRLEIVSQDGQVLGDVVELMTVTVQ